MPHRVARALLRLPGANFADGLTAGEGRPDLARAREQHGEYARALAACGLACTVLPADERFPDGCFVEDTAIVTPKAAIITRPGAPSRAGETAAIRSALGAFYPDVLEITAPGTVDGGDVCQTDRGFLIGVSARTNESGARQLATLLADLGHASTLVDIRHCAGLLHLKTGIAYLGDGRMAMADGLASWPAFAPYEPVVVSIEETYAANCVRINHGVLVAAGYPRFTERLAALGYDPHLVPMSEFRRMDGGLSCLSLRF